MTRGSFWLRAPKAPDPFGGAAWRPAQPRRFWRPDVFNRPGRTLFGLQGSAPSAPIPRGSFGPDPLDPPQGRLGPQKEFLAPGPQPGLPKRYLRAPLAPTYRSFGVGFIETSETLRETTPRSFSLDIQRAPTGAPAMHRPLGPRHKKNELSAIITIISPPLNGYFSFINSWGLKEPRPTMGVLRIRFKKNSFILIFYFLN